MTNKTISAACEAVGCSVSALRGWERAGLLAFEIPRDHFGRRMFGDEDIQLLRLFIAKRAKANERARRRNK